MSIAVQIERRLAGVRAQLPAVLADQIEEGSASPMELIQSAIDATVAVSQDLVGLASVVDAVIEVLDIEAAVKASLRQRFPTE